MCCVIVTPSSASLTPRISAAYDTACRTVAWVGGTWVQSESRYCKPFISKGETSGKLGEATDYSSVSI